jgi:hypothetical protein
MTQAVTVIPAETDLLCEGCGYTLNGLPTGGNCPECGRPIEQSLGTHRQYTEFETSPSVRTFFRTSWRALVHPTQFYRTLITRVGDDACGLFPVVHWLGASLLFGIAAHVHAALLAGFPSSAMAWGAGWLWLAVGLIVYVWMYLLTGVAGRLSAWEAAYRGLRLPFAVVRRGLCFHAPHYLPVALTVLITVLADYAVVRLWYVYDWQFTYLLLLCLEVVAGALYLFFTYWIAMKNMMYANR